jgi:hypothetical protein
MKQLMLDPGGNDRLDYALAKINANFAALFAGAGSSGLPGVPLLSAMTPVNMAGIKTNDNSPVAINIDNTDNAFSGVVGYTFTAPQFAKPYRVGLFLQGLGNNGSQPSWVTGFCDATGKMAVINLDYNGVCTVYEMASATSGFGIQIGGFGTLSGYQQYVWYGLRSDGVRAYLELSRDGVNFTTLCFGTLTQLGLVDVGKIFWGMNSGNGGDGEQMVTLRSVNLDGMAGNFFSI